MRLDPPDPTALALLRDLWEWDHGSIGVLADWCEETEDPRAEQVRALWLGEDPWACDVALRLFTKYRGERLRVYPWQRELWPGETVRSGVMLNGERAWEFIWYCWRIHYSTDRKGLVCWYGSAVGYPELDPAPKKESADVMRAFERLRLRLNTLAKQEAKT